MSTNLEPTSSYPALRLFSRKNVLAGLMFMGVGLLGLIASRNYPIGTAVRMSTGYVPRLLCWLLVGLGGIILVQGLREPGTVPRNAPETAGTAPEAHIQPSMLARLWPVLVVSGSLVAFAFTIERLGLVVSILILTAIGALAARGIKAWEAAATAVGLILLSWVIFIRGLGLTIPVWPDL